MSDDQDECEWVKVFSGTPGSPGQKAVKRLCVCYILTENASVYLIGCIFLYISLSGEIVRTGMVVNAVICC